MIELEMTQLLIIPAVVGLVQAIKNAGVPSKYAPLAAVVLGIGLSLAFDLSVMSAVVGILSGLAAVGLYEFPKPELETTSISQVTLTTAETPVVDKVVSKTKKK